MTIVANDVTSGQVLRAIAELTDPAGVLSMYVTADPREMSATRPGWQVRAANELAALERRLRMDHDAGRADVLAYRLGDVQRELYGLLSGATPGRGRALFLALSSETVISVATQVPLGDHINFGSTAYLRPLLAVLSAHPLAGVVAVSGHGVHVVDVRPGHASDIETQRYEPSDTGRHGLTGPAAATPALAQHGSAQHDFYARREATRLARFLRNAAGRVAELASERGWQYLVVTGDPERTSALVAGLPHELAIPAVTATHRVAGLSAARIHQAVAAELENVRHRCARALVHNARDLGLGGGAGAYGLADTLTALAEGRVLHLLLAESGEWVGRVDPDGRLHPEFVAVPQLAESDLTHEPRLGDRMAAAALRQGGRVTLLDPVDAVGLVDASGVAAILRW